MVVKNLTFEINKLGLLKEVEKDILIDAYQTLFIKMYGFDAFDAFVKVANTNPKEAYERSNKNESLANNYTKAVQLIETLSDENYELLLIYEDDKLIAGGRLNLKDEKIAKLLEIAVVKEKLKEEKDIWYATIKYIEEYLQNLGYAKMYLEVPLKEVKLLKVASDLGFQEDPLDIEVDEEVYTYVLNKKLESN